MQLLLAIRGPVVLLVFPDPQECASKIVLLQVSDNMYGFLSLFVVVMSVTLYVSRVLPWRQQEGHIISDKSM